MELLGYPAEDDDHEIANHDGDNDNIAMMKMGGGH